MFKKIIIALGVLLIFLFCSAYFWWTMQKEEYAAYRKTGAPILMYHAICTSEGKEHWPQSLILKPKLFEEQMKYLHDAGYKVVSVKELAEKLESGASVDKYVGLTFDDGYIDNYTTALPIMKKYDATGTFFIVFADIGKKDKMGDKEILDLVADGMELGSHTINHAPLTKIEPKYLVWEISVSKYFMKKRFDSYIVRTLSYPNGGYNDEVIATAKKYGYYRAVTGHVGLNTPFGYKKSPMEMYRVNVMDDGKGLEGFKNKLEQAYFFGFLKTKGIDVNKIRDIFAK